MSGNNPIAPCFICGTEHAVFGACPMQMFPAWTPLLAPQGGSVRQQMHPSLAAFLDEVWNNKYQITDHNDVYDMYNDAPGAITSPRAQECFQYVDELVRLERANECTVSVQDYEGFNFSDLASWAQDKTASAMLKQSPRFKQLKAMYPQQPMHKVYRNDFFDTFYHFLPFHRAECTQRVYLNVKSHHAVEVMKFVAPSIVPGVPGVSDAKIAGPRAAGGRIDTIVIYCSGEAATNMTLERLTEYQRLKGDSFFGDATPKMTEPAGLKGVAVGAEPKLDNLGPDAARLLPPPNKKESFGGMRSKLIYDALRKSNDQNAFFAESMRLFVDARLNPTAPHIN